MAAKRIHSEESLTKDIVAVAKKLGRMPSSNEFVRERKISFSTLQRHGGWAALQARAGALVPANIPSREVEERLAREHAMRENAKSKRTELKGIIRSLERRNSQLGEANEFLLAVNELTVEWTPRPIVASKRRRRLPEAAYLAMASDWHVGERVRPEQIGFRNEYNPEIAQERGHYFWRSNLVMLNAARAAWHIDRMVLWIGGDLMTGYIHEEYESENFLSPTEECLLAFEMLISGIDFLLAEGDLKEILIATSIGNHGRTGKNRRIAGDFRNSYEHMMYQLLARHYKDEKRVKFQLGTGYYNIIDVFGFKVRASHGEQVRSQGGVGGLAPPLYRRLGKLDPMGIDIQGHHHQLDFLRKFARNGSLIGWNLFAETLACEPEPPMQGSFIIDAKHQVACNFNPIFVEKNFNGSKVIR